MPMPSAPMHVAPSPPPSADMRPVVIVAAAASEAARFPASTFRLVQARTTADVCQAVQLLKPLVVAVDWDDPLIDGREVCHAAAASLVLMTTSDPARVPAGLKAGCHGVLLKPFPVNLAAARLGRLWREAQGAALTSYRARRGTNRIWPDSACPRCAAPGATSFDASSHRRMWFACLTCDHVWVDSRRE